MLDKKSSIYSDRPVLQMGGELVGWKNTLVLLPYGDRFRRYRRLFHNLIGSASTMKQFLPAEELETRRFLRRVLTKPDDLAAHIRKYVLVHLFDAIPGPHSLLRKELRVPSSSASRTATRSGRRMIPSSSWRIRQRNNSPFQRLQASSW